MDIFEMIYILRKPIITLILTFVISFIAVEVHERYKKFNTRNSKPFIKQRDDYKKERLI